MEVKGSSSSSSSSSLFNARWNPTKEQITILEALYSQGLRTPTSEQIQQITIKLREFGTTEGKNVFYWFQNHKARQRQKLKQDRLAYYSRLFSHGVVPQSHQSSNGICGPYLPVTQLAGVGPVGCYPNMYMAQVPMQMNPFQQEPFQAMDFNCAKKIQTNSYHVVNLDNPLADIETLPLFPLHPTGILEAEKSGSSLTSASVDYSDHECLEDCEREEECENLVNNPPYFNFFG